MNNLILNIGDWSDDGHGKNDTYHINTTLTVSEIRKAYKDASVKYNFGMHSKDAAGLAPVALYTGGKYSHEKDMDTFTYIHKLFPEIDIDPEDEYSISSTTYAEIFVAMVKGVRPDAFVEIVPEDRSLHINGMWNEELNESFGYEVYMH